MFPGMASSELERYAKALLYDHATGRFDHPDQLSSGVACPRHAGASEAHPDDADAEDGDRSYSDGSAGGLIVFAPDVSTKPENITCNPHSHSKRGTIFVLRGTKRCKNQESECAYFSGNAFACIPYLYRVRLEVRNVPPPTKRDTRQFFVVTKVVRQTAEECSARGVVALLQFVLGKSQDKVEKILRMGGYDFDRDAMLYPPNETGPLLGMGFNGTTEPADFRNRQLSKYRLMVEILEYAQEQEDSTKNREYILHCLELHMPESFRRMARNNPDIEAAYDNLLYSPELVERARQQKDYTAMEQCQRVSAAMAHRRRKELKDKHKIPMSVQVQRHPGVVEYFTHPAFALLAKYRSRDWLYGLTVEEIYQLHDLLFDKETLSQYESDHRRGLTERLRCRNLLPAYRLCFAPLMCDDEDTDEAQDQANYLDVDFTSYPHAFTSRKTSSVAREMSIHELLNYLDDVCPLNDDNEYAEGVKPILSEDEIFDVYLYYVIQTISYRDAHTCLRVADLFHRVQFDLGLTSMASLVDTQMNHHSIYNPKSKAARLALAQRLIPRLGDSDFTCDDVLLRARIYASVCRLSAHIKDAVMEEGRGNGQVTVLEVPTVEGGLLVDDMRLQIALGSAGHTEAVLKAVADLQLDDCRIYLNNVHKDDQLIVEAMDGICENFVTSSGQPPTLSPFFDLVVNEGWPLETQRLWLAWYRGLPSDDILAIYSDAIALSDEERTPEQRVVMALEEDDADRIVLPDHNLCPEQRVAELSIRHGPVTILTGAAGSGKSALVAQMLQQCMPGTVIAFTFMLSHAMNLTNATKMELPAVCTMDQALADHHATCCNMEGGLPTTLMIIRKAVACKKPSPFMRIVGGVYEKCPYERVEVAIFDEYGTIDDPRFAKIISMLQRCCLRLRRVIFAGDMMQLPPIGRGNLGRDLCYAFGTIPFEHVHRAGCEDLIQLSRAINDNRPDRMELATEYIKFFPCTTEAWKKSCKRGAPDNIGAIIKDIFREADLPGSRLAYLDSMVICDSRAMCKEMAAIVDYERLRRLKLGPSNSKKDRTLMAQADWARAKKSLTYHQSGQFRTDRYFPGQKIRSERTIRDIGLINGEVFVVMAVIKGHFLHMSYGALGKLYEECFEHVCAKVVQYATVESFTNAKAPEPIERLIEAYKEDLLFARKVRNCAYVDMKQHIAAQANCQRLEANALTQFMAGKFNRTEVHIAKRCSEGLSHGARNLGHTWMHYHPVTVRRRLFINDNTNTITNDYFRGGGGGGGGRPLSAPQPTDAEQRADRCIDWLLQQKALVDGVDKDFESFVKKCKDENKPPPKAWSFSDRIMQLMEIAPETNAAAGNFIRGPLRDSISQAVSDLLADTAATEHAVEFDGTADASMAAQASEMGPCFHAIRRGAEAYYADGRNKVDITENDYLSFRMTSSSLPHSGVLLDQEGRDGPCGIKFMQCYALGNPKKIVYIPIVSTVTNYLKSAATTTVHRAQSNNAGTVIPVIPYPISRKGLYTAATRASDGLMRDRAKAGLGNNCWIISSDTFALLGSLERTTMARQSVLGYKLRIRCMTRLFQSGLLDDCEEELCEIREMHRRNVDRARREEESREARDKRVREHGKHYGLTMPWNQVLPVRCLDHQQMAYLKSVQDSLPFHIYDDQWRPTPSLMRKEAYDQCTWQYAHEEDHDAYLWNEAGWHSSSDMEVDDEDE